MNGEQTMLLLNRRGFSSFVACRACGERVQCLNCAVTLTYHRRDRRLLCHYCGYAETRAVRSARSARASTSIFWAWDRRTSKRSCTANFRARAIARLDRDTVTGKRQFEDILQGFRERNFDILVGTQMIAKGHDIPNVTLVGVVSADVGLGMPDFRAAERTFQLLTQVAGRAGRGDLPGIVLMQTINPDHYAIRMAAAQDYQAFYREGAAVPALDALPAVHRHGQPAGAQRKAGGRAAPERGAGPSPDACAGKDEGHGPGGSARAAPEERVSLSAADQVGQPQGAE